MTRIRQRVSRLRRGGDAGVTLVEVMVTMAIMGTLMAIFTTGILQVYRAANATEAMSVAQSQLHIAFQRLDTHIRYASWIAAPGQVGQSWYVEFAHLDRSTRQPRCGQLRLNLDTGVLHLRSWTPGTPPPADQAGPALSSHIVTDPTLLAAEPVFTRQTAGSYPYAGQSHGVGASFAPDFQRLHLQLTARVGATERASTSKADVTFTALNTSRDTPAGNNCSEGRPAV